VTPPYFLFLSIDKLLRFMIGSPFFFSIWSYTNALISIELGDMASAHLLLSSKLENDLSHSYDICFQFHFYYCVLRDETNKIKSHLHVF
jgi:hypothetical protein